MRHRWQRITTAAALATLVLAPSAQAAVQIERLGLERVSFMLVRTSTDASASMHLNLSVVPGERAAVYSVTFATLRRGRITSVDLAGASSPGASDHTQVRANGTSTSLCSRGVCQLDWETLTSGVGAGASGGPNGPNVLFVVAQAPGGSVGYSVDLVGWQLIPTSFTYRWVNGVDSAAVGAFAGPYGVEAFTDASLRGGTSGSIAIAIAPCDANGTNAASKGIGRLTLDGGVTQPTFTCPLNANPVGSWATRATDWRVHGQVAGSAGGHDTRLFVLDLPPRLPLPKDWAWR